MFVYLHVFVSICFSVSGQLFLKTGMIKLDSPLVFTLRHPSSWWPVATSPWIWAGLVCWVGSTLFWLIAISRSPLSQIHGVNALTYVLVPLLASKFLGEHLRPGQSLGILCICVGVLLVLHPGIPGVTNGSR